MGNELLREKQTLRDMIRIYCRGNNHDYEGRDCCGPCSELLRYAYARLDNCVFGEDKPVCAKCPIHCYRMEQRQRIIMVMRYSGPRMFVRHPLSAIRHLVNHLVYERKVPTT
ncbi:MAG: nitrous oxide-stimulated promoter family protein [Candidatus Omnitrophica bacterium]|nr:nitrous oxide-stimulated promoter family protein [Candidatus Omnitrophota bacterium]MDD5672005.1 nitrous oxide-stimulated promoter family protein [Candidatus Omnitrophota bacterium]